MAVDSALHPCAAVVCVVSDFVSVCVCMQATAIQHASQHLPQPLCHNWSATHPGHLKRSTWAPQGDYAAAYLHICSEELQHLQQHDRAMSVDMIDKAGSISATVQTLLHNSFKLAVFTCLQDRAIFPFALMAMQLSGTGDDTLFFGVMRRPESTAGSTTHSVRFWTNASGVIMCADSSTEAVFGVSASQLVGRQFTSLCSDAEPVQEWISTAASREDGDSLGQVQATMLHAYLPAVDVELGIQFGGAVEATSECRFMIIEVSSLGLYVVMLQQYELHAGCASNTMSWQATAWLHLHIHSGTPPCSLGLLLTHALIVFAWQAQLLSCAGDVMALNQKGRLVYVTDRLAGMLGYPPSALVKMDLNALLPPPFSQIHGSWFKVSVCGG